MGPWTTTTPSDHVADGTDCDDTDGDVHPGATEVCDGVDNDCDSAVDDADDSVADQETWYVDGDGDGYGDPAEAILLCSESGAVSAEGTDCDDGDTATHPGAAEVCGDGVVNDCDGSAEDAWLACGHSGPVDLSAADGQFTGVAVNDYFGTSVAHAGDFDGDGVDDVIIGARAAESTLGTSGEPGAAFVFFGGGSLGKLPSSSADVTLEGEADHDNAGYVVGSAGDVDGDGFDDVLVGSPDAAQGGLSASGSLYLFGGGVTGVHSLSGSLAEWVGENGSDNAGYSTAGLGDFDGDGLADLAVGAKGYSPTEPGAVYVVSSADRGVNSLSLASLRMLGENDYDYVGESVGAAGDFDGDGLADLVAASIQHDEQTGIVYVVFGGAKGELGLAAADVTLTGDVAGDQCGKSVHGVGDYTGDGVDDLLVGAYYGTGDTAQSGVTYLVPGGTVGTAVIGTVSYATFEGIEEGDLSGVSAVSPGDVDGDGQPDLLIGAHVEDDGGASAGAAYLMLGRQSGVVDLSTAQATFIGEETNDRAGERVSPAGDFDDDGFDDLMIAAPYNSDAASDAGSVYLMLGGGY